jgi:intracellular sulfur oxidation DsrE/DsrF family protein
LRAATLQGQTTEAAIETGKSWGLKGLEPAVREELARQAGDKPVAGQAERPPLKFPRISLAGGVHALAGDVSMPSADSEHRLVIDASSDESNDSGLNRRLETAARAVNLYALAGVPADKLKLALVFHGKATSIVLADASFQAHFGKPNPNAALMTELHKAGVEFFVCGQAMTHAGYSAAEVRSDVHVALSAMTALEGLQSAGYSLIP